MNLLAALAIVAATCSSNAPQEGNCGGHPWVSSWQPYAPPPHWVKLTLAAGNSPRVPVGAVSYTMRQDGGTNGTLKRWSLDCDGVQVATGITGLAQQPRQPAVQLVDLAGRQCWELTLRFIETWGGSGPATWASADAVTLEAAATCDPCASGYSHTPVLGARPGRVLRGGWPAELWQMGDHAPLAVFDCASWTNDDGETVRVTPFVDTKVALQRYAELPPGVLSTFYVKTPCDEPDCISDPIPICGPCVWPVSLADRKGSYRRAKAACACGVDR